MLLSMKNYFIGSKRSFKISNSLWVIFFGIISLEGPPLFWCRVYAWLKGINLSLYPCTISIGQVTFFIISWLMNLSLTIAEGNDPNKDLTAFFNEVYGESNIKLEGFEVDASIQEGPDPIDLPNTTISLESYFILLRTKSYTIWELY